MKKQQKKFIQQAISFILILVLSVTSINLSVFADSFIGPVIYDNESYDTIEKALEAAIDRGDISPVLSISEDIDFSGSITVSDNRKLTIRSYRESKVTITLAKETANHIVFTVNEECSLIFDNVDIQGNYVGVTDDNGDVSYAEAFRYKKCIFDNYSDIILNDVIIKNFSLGSYGLFKMKNGNLEMNAASGIRNIDTGTNGVLVRAEGESKVQGGTITGLTAYAGYGYSTSIQSKSSGSQLILDSIIFDGNQTGFVSAYDLIMKDCEIRNNKSVYDFVTSLNSAYINGCVFDNNLGHYDGIIKMKDGEIINTDFTKQASTYGSSRFLITDGDVVFGGVKISESSSGGSAGFVSLINSNLTIKKEDYDSKVFGNNIQLDENIFDNNTRGSSIYVDKSSSLTVFHAKFTNNEADNGGAIYNCGTTSLYNAQFSGNKANKTNSNNTNEVAKGEAVYNSGVLNLYSSVNLTDDNIYECDGSRLVVKEEMLLHSEINPVHIALEKTVDSHETTVAEYDAENSEELAYQSVQNKSWKILSVSEKKNNTIAANGKNIVFNADTMEKNITFKTESGVAVSGIIYSISKKANGGTVGLGYTEPSNEKGQITLSNLYDGTYTLNIVSVPGSVESGNSNKKINLTVDTDMGVVKYGDAITTEDFSVSFADFNPVPIAVINADKKCAKINEGINFDGSDSTDDTEVTAYKWKFSDGDSATGKEVTHKFKKEGTYTATLTVKDNKGKTSSQTYTVTVKGTLDNQYKLTIHVKSSNGDKAVANATVEVLDMDGNSICTSSNGDGVAELYVTANNNYTVNGYASSYYMKSVNLYMPASDRTIDLYLSDIDTVYVDLGVKRISKEEAEELGVDTTAEENKACYKHEVEVEFSYDKEHSAGYCSSVRFITILNADGSILKELYKNYGGKRITKVKDGFYLAISSETTWLEEMFDVELLVINNSSAEKITDCSAEINLTDGLALAAMVNQQDNLSAVNIGNLNPGETFTHHWVVRGTKEGNNYVGATVEGKQVNINDESISSAFSDKYVCTTPIVVYGGNALNLYISGKSYITSPDYIEVSYVLANVSDITLYDVEFVLSKGDTYAVGSAKDILDENYRVIPSKVGDRVVNGKTQTLSEMKPGDVISVSTTIYVSGAENREYYINNVISSNIGGNMRIPTVSEFLFIASRYRKSIYENSNVQESSSGDPVDMLTGAYTDEHSDATIKGLKDFSLTRKYGSSTGTDGVYGYGWRDDFTYFLQVTETGDMTMNFPNGDRAYFEKLSDGGFASASGSELTLTVKRKNNSKGNVQPIEGSENREGILSYADEDLTGATVNRQDGTVYEFDKNMKVTKIVDAEGYTTKYSYNSSGNVIKVETDTGYVTFSYNKSDRITKAVMSSGEEVAYDYNEEGYLCSVTNADGDTMYYAYDSNGYIVKVTDFIGNISIENEYDDYGRVVKQYVQGEGTYRFEYDDKNKINTCTGENGYEHTIKYDDSYRITEDTKNGSETYKYDDNSYLISQKDALGNKTTYEYDSLGRIVKINYYEDDYKTSEAYKYDVTGKIIEIKNRNGATTKYSYSEKNRLSSIVNNNGAETRYVYDEKGNIILEVHSDGGVKTYTYDSAGRKLSEKDENGNSIVYEYDSAGRVLSETTDDGCYTSYTYSKAGKLLTETDANGNTITYTVNANGYNTAVIYSDGTSEQAVYNIQNRTTEESDRTGNKVSYEYDNAGNVTAVINKRGFKTSYAYDGYGRNTAVKNALDNQWKYTYDANDNITEVVNPLKHHVAIVYNAKGKVVSYTDENGNTTSYTYDNVGNTTSVTDANGEKTTYRYDLNNNVIEVKDANGGITTYAYDSMNRVISKTDANGATTGYVYDCKGQVTKETDAGGNVTEYAYDAGGRVTMVKDALSQITSYTYDGNGNITSIIKPDGTTVSYTYDSDNNNTSVTDGRGNKTEYTYGPTGLLIKERSAVGLDTYYKYDNEENCTKVTYADGSYIRYTYDAVSQLTKEETSDGRITSYTYDRLGRLLTKTSPDGNTVKYTYDKVGNVLTETDGNGSVTKYTYDALSNVISKTDANGGTITYEYDALSNVTKITDALGGTMSYTYDELSRIKTSTDALNNTKTYQYDSLGNITSVTDEEGGVTTNEYDALSRVIKTTNPAGETTEYEYDETGRLVKEIRSDGKYIAYTYDAAGNLVSESDYHGTATRYAYNNDNVMCEKSRGDYSEKYTLDKKNRVTLITYSDSSTDGYTYDNHDNVTSYKDRNGNVTTYTYDSMDNMIKSVDPAGDATEYQYDKDRNITKQILHRTEGDSVEDEVTVYTYDKCGNLISKTDAIGAEITYDYDLNGNLLTETNSSGTVVKAYTYDVINQVTSKTVNTKTTLFEYNKTGAVVNVQSSDNSVSYKRDPLNRIVESVQNGKKTQYVYNNLGQQSEITYPDGSVNKMYYNDNGVLYKSVTSNGTVLYTFDADDRVISKTTTNAVENGKEDKAVEVENYTYDNNGRILTSTYSNGTNTVVTDEYAYDYNGNITEHIMRDVRTGKETDNKYTYDYLDRLKSEEVLNKSEAGETSEKKEYEYDSVGNLVKEITGDRQTAYEYNNLNQLVKKTGENEITDYIYDVNGALSIKRDGMTGKVFSRYTNDDEGKLVQSISYIYSGNKTTSTTTKRKYDVNGYVTEEKTDVASFRTVSGMTIVCPDFGVTDTKNYTYDYTAEVPQLISCESMEGTTVDYMYGNGRVAAVVSNEQGDDGDAGANGFRQSYNLSTDKNGTTTFATDRDGNTVAETTYGTWAEVLEVTKIAVSDTIDTDITTSYTGYIYSEEQDHWNAGERVYSATEKHFTSMDPEAGNVYEKMRINVYVYAGNNPVTNIDPDGRAFFQDAWNYVSDKVSGAWDCVTDKASDAWNYVSDKVSVVWNHVTDEVTYIGNAISGTFDRLACALNTTKSDIAGKLLIGTIGIAVAVATTAVTGGLSLGWTAATIGATVFTEAAVGAAIGGAAYTATHSMDEYKVEDCLAEMGNGFLDGFALGGLFQGASKGYSAVKSWVKTGETTAKFTEVVESGNKTGKLFKNQTLLEEHYGKHGQEIADVLKESNYSIDKYLDDANYIINNGTYVPELNGYVSFMSGKKYGFVGLDRTTGDITTFHIKNVSELIKKAPSLGFER